jgi:hypothetical protein
VVGVAAVRAVGYIADPSRVLLRSIVLGATVVSGAIALFIQAQLRAANPELAGFDTWAYWAVDPGNPYTLPPTWQRGTFLYSPVVAQAMAPLGVLPWDFVRDAWGIVQIGLLALLTGPLAGPLAFTQPVRVELVFGNVNLLIAAVALVGLRWPALWSIPILLKVTPGIGLLWFVARREWPALALAALTTGLIVSVSIVLAPGLWLDWGRALVASSEIHPDLPLVPPWPIRIAMASAMIWIGARRDWAWVVPVATLLSLGHLWLSSLTIALGAVGWLFWKILRQGSYGWGETTRQV